MRSILVYQHAIHIRGQNYTNRTINRLMMTIANYVIGVMTTTLAATTITDKRRERKELNEICPEILQTM